MNRERHKFLVVLLIETVSKLRKKASMKICDGGVSQIAYRCLIPLKGDRVQQKGMGQDYDSMRVEKHWNSFPESWEKPHP